MRCDCGHSQRYHRPVMTPGEVTVKGRTYTRMLQAGYGPCRAKRCECRLFKDDGPTP